MIDAVKNNPAQSALVAVAIAALSGGVSVGTNNVQERSATNAQEAQAAELRRIERKFTREIDAMQADQQLLKEKINWVLTNNVDFLTTIAPSAALAAAPPPPMEITLDAFMIEEAADAVEEEAGEDDD